METRTVDTRVLLRRFQAVAEKTRFGIVRLLACGEHCVCELQDELEAAQSRLSFHLKKLKDAGVVSDRRDGRWVYYSLVPDALDEMRAFLGEVNPEEGLGAPGLREVFGSEGASGSPGASAPDGAPASASDAGPGSGSTGSCCS